MQVCVRSSNWKPVAALRLPIRILLANQNFPSSHHMFVLMATSEESFWNFVLWLSYRLITYDSNVRVLVILLVGRITLFPRNRMLRNWDLLDSHRGVEPRSFIPMFSSRRVCNLTAISRGPVQGGEIECVIPLASFSSASHEAFLPTAGPRGSGHSGRQ